MNKNDIRKNLSKRLDQRIESLFEEKRGSKKDDKDKKKASKEEPFVEDADRDSDEEKEEKKKKKLRKEPGAFQKLSSTGHADSVVAEEIDSRLKKEVDKMSRNMDDIDIIMKLSERKGSKKLSKKELEEVAEYLAEERLEG